MPNTSKESVNKRFEKMYEVLSLHFKEAMLLAGQCTLQEDRVTIPYKAIYQHRDKAIEYVESFLHSERKLLLEEVKGMVEGKMRNVPASVQCRVATDCNWCKGRSDVSYHDALTDISTSLNQLLEDNK